MKVLYFARFRQAIGRGMDDVAPPAGLRTVRDLMAWLTARDEGVAAALSDLRVVKVAVNQKQATLDASLEGATEVAFFPPVTGG